MKNKKFIWTKGKFAIAACSLAATAGIAATLVTSCGCGQKKTEIPADSIKIENGKVTGLKDGDYSQYTTINLPSDTSVTTIAEGAFKNVFASSNGVIGAGNINTIKVHANIKKIEKEAFFGCNSIETLDFSEYDETGLKNIFSDENMGDNIFASWNTKQKGTLVFKDGISSEMQTKAKTWALMAGMPKKWFTPETQPEITNLEISSTSSTASSINCKQYEEKLDPSQWTIKYRGEDVTSDIKIKLIPEEGTETLPEWIEFKQTSTGVWQFHITDDCVPKNDGTPYKFKVRAIYTHNQTEVYGQTENTISLDVEKKTVTVEGDKQLTGKSYTTGSSSNYKAKLNGTETVATWTLSDTFGGKVSIDGNGKVTWNQNITTGVYNFDVRATYKVSEKHSVSSDAYPVTLTISDRKVSVTGGSQILTATELIAGKDSKAWTASLEPANGTEFSLVDTTGTALPEDSPLFINKTSGVVEWKNTVGLKHNNTQFKVKATIDGKWIGYSEVITLLVGQQTPSIKGDTVLSSLDYTAGYWKNPFAAYVGDIPMTAENVTWSLNGAPEQFAITNGEAEYQNKYGYLVWDPLPSGATYAFNVECEFTYEGTVRHPDPLHITFNVDKREAKVEGGSTKINTAREGKAGEDTLTWKVNIADKPVVWDIVDSTTKEVKTITGLSVVDGKVKWSNQIQSNTYKFCVRAIIDGRQEWTAYSSEITMVVAQEELTISGGTTELHSKDYMEGQDTNKWTATIAGSSTLATWHLTNTHSGQITIDSNGIVHWSDTLGNDTYETEVYATCTYAGTEHISKHTSIKLVVSETTATIVADSGSTTLQASAGVAGQDSKKWQVQLSDAERTIEKTNFYLFDKTSGERIVSDDLWITNDGCVNWSKNITAGTYTFYVYALVNDSWISTEASVPTVTLTVAQETDLGNDDWQLDDQGYIVGIKTDISGYVNNHKAVINIDDTTSAGTTIKGIKSIPAVVGENKITELEINNTYNHDITLTSGSIQGFTNLNKISLNENSSTTGWLTVDAGVFNESEKTTCKTLVIGKTCVSDSVFKDWQITNLKMNEKTGTIGKSAFENLNSGNKITTEGKFFGKTYIVNAFGGFGESAFANSGISVTGDWEMAASTHATLAKNVFAGCKYLNVNLTVYNEVTIDENAFNGSGITGVTFKENLSTPTTRVEANAFANCYSLESITFHKALAYLGNNAFANAKSLATINLESLTTAKLANEIGTNVFDGAADNGTVKSNTTLAELPKAQLVVDWYRLLTTQKLPDTWSYSPEAGFKINWNVSTTGIEVEKKQVAYYDEDLVIPYTVLTGYQLDFSKCKIVAGGQTITHDNETDKIYFTKDGNKIFISKEYITSNISIDLFVKEETKITEPLDHQVVAEKKTVDSAKKWVGVMEGFSQTNGDLSNFEAIMDDVDDLANKMEGDPVCSVIDRGQGTFAIQFIITPKEGIELAKTVHNITFQITDKATGQVFKLNHNKDKYKVGFDYEDVTISNDKLTIDANGEVTGFNDTSWEVDDKWFIFDFKLGNVNGKFYKGFAQSFWDHLPQVVKNGLWSLSIEVTDANCDSKVNLPYLTTGATDFMYLDTFILKVQNPDWGQRFTVNNSVIGSYANFTHVEFSGVELTISFGGGRISNVKELHLGKNVTFPDNAFADLHYLHIIDLSEIGPEVPTEEQWGTDLFSNAGQDVSFNIIYIHADAEYMKWEYFAASTLGLNIGKTGAPGTYELVNKE